MKLPDLTVGVSSPYCFVGSGIPPKQKIFRIHPADSAGFLRRGIKPTVFLMKLHGLTPVVSSKQASQAKLVFAVCSPANGGITRKHCLLRRSSRFGCEGWTFTALRSWFSALLIKLNIITLLYPKYFSLQLLR